MKTLRGEEHFRSAPSLTNADVLMDKYVLHFTILIIPIFKHVVSLRERPVTKKQARKSTDKDTCTDPIVYFLIFDVFFPYNDEKCP